VNVIAHHRSNVRNRTEVVDQLMNLVDSTLEQHTTGIGRSVSAPIARLDAESTRVRGGSLELATLPNLPLRINSRTVRAAGSPSRPVCPTRLSHLSGAGSQRWCRVLRVMNTEVSRQRHATLVSRRRRLAARDTWHRSRRQRRQVLGNRVAPRNCPPRRPPPPFGRVQGLRVAVVDSNQFEQAGFAHRHTPIGAEVAHPHLADLESCA